MFITVNKGKPSEIALPSVTTAGYLAKRLAVVFNLDDDLPWKLFILLGNDGVRMGDSVTIGEIVKLYGDNIIMFPLIC